MNSQETNTLLREIEGLRSQRDAAEQERDRMQAIAGKALEAVRSTQRADRERDAALSQLAERDQQLAALREGRQAALLALDADCMALCDSNASSAPCSCWPDRIDRARRALLAPPATEGVENCSLSREFRDGVACSPTRLDGVCHNHQVIAGLRHHATEADHWEGRARSLTQSLRACQGIIHEGLHGGRPTDPEHQEWCQQPACVRVRALLAPPAGEQEAE